MKANRRYISRERETIWFDRVVEPQAIKLLAHAPDARMEQHIAEMRERSYVRHALAHHIETNNLERVAALRRKHGI